MGDATQPRLLRLDGLRGFAALSVVGSHLLLLDPFFSTLLYQRAGWDGDHPLKSLIYFSPLHLAAAGTEAVAVFFVLSGAVLTRAYPGSRSLRASYAVPRAVRLYLPIWGSLLLALTLGSLRPDATEGLSHWHRRQRSGQTWGTLLDHPARFLHDASVVKGATALNSALWSMQIEVIASALLFLVWLAARRPALTMPLAVLAVVVLAEQHTSLWKWGLFFLAGSLMTRAGLSVSRRASVALLLTGVVALSAPWVARGAGRPLAGGWGSTVLLLLGSTAVVAAVHGPSPLDRALLSRPGRWLGMRSYSLYLVQSPVLVFFGLWIAAESHGSVHWFLWYPVIVAGVLLSTEVFGRVVEGPSHRLARALRARTATDAPRSGWSLLSPRPRRTAMHGSAPRPPRQEPALASSTESTSE